MQQHRLDRLKQFVYDCFPSKIFIMIGINDLADRIFSPKQIVQGIEQIIKKIIRFDSQIEIYIQSTLPTTGKYDNLNDLILEYNKYLSKISNHHSVNFINLYSHFTNIKNSLNTVFTKDGLHLNSQGYKLWKNLIPPYLN